MSVSEFQQNFIYKNRLPTVISEQSVIYWSLVQNPAHKESNWADMGACNETIKGNNIKKTIRYR